VAGVLSQSSFLFRFNRLFPRPIVPLSRPRLACSGPLHICAITRVFYATSIHPEGVPMKKLFALSANGGRCRLVVC